MLWETFTLCIMTDWPQILCFGKVFHLQILPLLCFASWLLNSVWRWLTAHDVHVALQWSGDKHIILHCLATHRHHFIFLSALPLLYLIVILYWNKARQTATRYVNSQFSLKATVWRLLVSTVRTNSQSWQVFMGCFSGHVDALGVSRRICRGPFIICTVWGLAFWFIGCDSDLHPWVGFRLNMCSTFLTSRSQVFAFSSSSLHSVGDVPWVQPVPRTRSLSVYSGSIYSTVG